MTNEPTSVLPPDPEKPGLHYIVGRDQKTESGFWDGDVWWVEDRMLTQEWAAADGFSYLCPIPPPDQLQAMREIVAMFALALGMHEIVDGPVSDETVIWTGYESHITAGLIRRAMGEGENK